MGGVSVCSARTLGPQPSPIERGWGERTSEIDSLREKVGMGWKSCVASYASLPYADSFHHSLTHSNSK